jgi:hemolysin activation/secretion protein
LVNFATAQETPAPDPGPEATIFINEYRVEGVHHLPRLAVESAVYPYLGPGRTRDDVELARAALEAAYHEAGFQTVAVQIPAQPLASGVIRLLAVERTVGRLRVKGAKYSSPQKIKALAPSLAEGSVIDFNQVSKDVVALNQSADRAVTPALRAGVAPDTVDVDLDVKETAPVHASVELNNRHGPETTSLRLSAAVSVGNIAQSGNSAGFSFQTSPQNTSEVKVFSGYYVQHFAGADWLSLMLTATKQDSNVSTLGDTAVAGRGKYASLHALFNLPAGDNFSHTAGLALNYKQFDQQVSLPAAGTTPAAIVVTPVTYWPLEATYAATWRGKRATTEFNAALAFHLRGLGSDTAEFGTNRYKADANFIIFRGDLAHTQELPAGFQLFGKLQGQLADQPLLSGEQISGGGLGTARGYLEAQAVGDSGAFGTIELHSPSLLGAVKALKGEWRLYAFADSGWLKVKDPLPEQKNHYDFLSYGVGSRLRLFDRFDGTIVASLPQLTVGQTKAKDWQFTFKAALNY